MSNCKSRRISNYKKGYAIIDKICCGLVLGGSVAFMVGMVAYANQRDAKEFSQQQPMVIRIDK
jgi:hypothetical protein